MAFSLVSPPMPLLLGKNDTDRRDVSTEVQITSSRFLFRNSKAKLALLVLYGNRQTKRERI